MAWSPETPAVIGAATTAALRALPSGAEAQAVIARVSTSVTAFVGRALKGPLNRPVVINSFNDFQQRFGGLWQPATLGYAIEQYFENGGEQAIVVRVCNGGRAPSLRLPATGGLALTLRGMRPGTREVLRAAVDYDGIADDDSSSFNLVVQSLRQSASELIDEQEIYRKVSIDPRAEHCLARRLQRSQLVRLEGTLPTTRPLPSTASASTRGYVSALADGDDGDELTDYDLIGDAERGTGLAALAGAPHFGLLCVPPLSRERDLGLSTLLVAARLCRARHATLVVDPPLAWDNVAEARELIASWPFRCPDAVMYYPRVQALDRLRGRPEVFANCGAVAGMIARADGLHTVWMPMAEEPLLRSSMRPVTPLAADERALLAQCGINQLQSVRTPPGQESGVRSLMPLAAARVEERWLAARRLAQFIAASVQAGTRWVAHEPNDLHTHTRLRGQLSAFLEALDQEGAFIGDGNDSGYYVICDERLNQEARLRFGARALFGYAGVRGGQYATYLLTQRPQESSVRPVSVNRLATATPRMVEDIETAILRGLLAGADSSQ